MEMYTVLPINICLLVHDFTLNCSMHAYCPTDSNHYPNNPVYVQHKPLHLMSNLYSFDTMIMLLIPANLYATELNDCLIYSSCMFPSGVIGRKRRNIWNHRERVSKQHEMWMADSHLNVDGKRSLHHTWT